MKKNISSRRVILLFMYLKDNYVNDFLSMIERINQKNASIQEKLYDSDLLKLSHYILKLNISIIYAKKLINLIAKSNTSAHQMMYYYEK